MFKRMAGQKAAAGLVVLLLLYTGFFTAYTFQRHRTFQTSGYDLGIFDQTLWNAAGGRGLTLTTIPGISHKWADHFDPVLVLFVPVYKLWPDPRTLLLLQAVIVAAGAVPVYWLARRYLKHGAMALAFAAIYLLFPALQAATIFDFHATTIAATFLAFSLWAMFEQKYRLLLVLAVLVMSCKEELSLHIVLLGLYVLFIQRRWRPGLLLAGGGLAWFGLANFVIIPAYSPTGDSIHLLRYDWLGRNMGEVVLAALTQPWLILGRVFGGDRLGYWFRLTMPVAFTSLLDPLTLLLGAPTMMINTLSAFDRQYFLDFYHYSAPVVPFVVVSGIRGTARLAGWLAPRLAGAPALVREGGAVVAVVFAFGLSYHMLLGYTPLRLGFAWPRPAPHHQAAYDMLRLVPPDAPVSAQNSLVPHLSRREKIYTFPEVQDAEYILLDVQGNTFPIQQKADYCAYVADFLQQTSYGVIQVRDSYILLQRGQAHRTRLSLSPTCAIQTVAEAGS